jgi:hypothetical protein
MDLDAETAWELARRRAARSVDTVPPDYQPILRAFLRPAAP